MNSAHLKCPFEIGQAVRAGISGPVMRIVAVYRGVVFLGTAQPDRYIVEWTATGILKQSNMTKEDLEAVDESVGMAGTCPVSVTMTTPIGGS